MTVGGLAEDATYEQLERLLIVVCSGKPRNLTWLLQWLNGWQVEFSSKKFGTLEATVENVLMFYEDDDVWTQWKEELEGHAV